MLTYVPEIDDLIWYSQKPYNQAFIRYIQEYPDSPQAVKFRANDGILVKHEGRIFVGHAGDEFRKQNPRVLKILEEYSDDSVYEETPPPTRPKNLKIKKLSHYIGQGNPYFERNPDSLKVGEDISARKSEQICVLKSKYPNLTDDQLRGYSLILKFLGKGVAWSHIVILTHLLRQDLSETRKIITAMINDNLLEIYALKNGESIVGITQQGINSLANKDFALRYKDTMSSISTFSNKFINQYIGLSEPFLKFRHNWMDKQAIRQISPRYQAYGFLPSALFYDRLGLNFIEVVTQIVSDQEFKYKIEQWCRLFDSTTNREPVLNYVYFFSPHKVMLINILNRLSLPEKYANRLIVFDIKEKLVPFNPVSPPQMAFQLQTVRTFEGPTLFNR